MHTISIFLPLTVVIFDIKVNIMITRKTIVRKRR